MAQSAAFIAQADRPENAYITKLIRFRPWLAGLALIFIQYSLYTNLLDLTFFLAPFEGGAATSPITALSTSLICAAIIGYSAGAPRWLGVTLACLALALALRNIMPQLTRLFTELTPPTNGVMGMDTFAVIALSALSFLLHKRAFRTSAALCFTALILLFNSLIGRSFGLPYFGGEMALGTMISLTVLALSMLTLFMNFTPTRILFLATDIGKTTRSMAALAFAVPWLCGMYLHHVSPHSDSKSAVEAVIITIIIASGVTTAIRSGNALEHADKARREALEAMELIAITDPLTGLLNRKGLDQCISKLRLEAQSTDKVLLLSLMDIDHFKQINDTYGHEMGDAVLQALKPALEPELRKADVFGRWGGEEFLFVIMLEGEAHHAERVLDRLKFSVRHIPKYLATLSAHAPREITCSFGGTLLGASETGYHAALQRADKGLYRAKKNGRNRVEFEPPLDDPPVLRVAGRTSSDTTLPVLNTKPLGL